MSNIVDFVKEWGVIVLHSSWSLLKMCIWGLAWNYGTQTVLILVLAVILLLAAAGFRGRFSRKSVGYDADLKAVSQHLNIISWSYALTSRRLYVSAGTERICGYRAEELMSRPELWARLVHPYDLPRVREAEKDLRSGTKVMLEHRLLMSDGSSRWIQNLAAPLKNAQGRIYCIEGIIIDVTEQKELEEKMKHLAFYDALTGLPNRSMFENYFANFITRGRVFQQKMAIVFIDLDAFKNVNDELGHDAGDVLLKEAAYRMKSLLRGCDLLSRLGGDEFVALLTRITDNSPALVGHRIVEAFWEPFEINGRNINVGVSVGISIYPDDGQDLETLIKNADQAMYMAKRKGKNTCCVYNPSALS